MRRDEVPEDLSALAFEFFFWFSRFEFALKENKYLKNDKAGARAEPGWKKFVETWQSQYQPSAASRKLLELAPKQQTVDEGQELTWRTISFSNEDSELQKTVQLLKTVRNNLFHGGKHGTRSWDDPGRTRELLSVSRTVLEDLTSLANLWPDYTRYY
jgi:hypothetical protein